MMPLQPLVVCQNFAGREQKRGTPQVAIARVAQQHRRQPDPVTRESFFKRAINPQLRRCAEILRRDQKMPSGRLQPLDLGVHAFGQLAIAGSE